MHSCLQLKFSPKGPPQAAPPSFFDFAAERQHSAQNLAALRQHAGVQYKRDPQFRSMITAAKTNMQSMRPTDRAKVARAMGKLLYQDEDLCIALVRSLDVELDESPPPAVAGIMCGLGQVAYRCASSLLSLCVVVQPHSRVSCCGGHATVGGVL